jgi:thioredoxin reductase
LRQRAADVVVVGAGPSGLSAATALRRAGVADVLVVDREPEAGGAPRHTGHLGFGIRDLSRVTTGPRYARWWVARAEEAGVAVLPATSVTGWTGPTTVRELHASAVVLATGCRERPRTARLIPGDRPAGIYTTGSLQRAVFLARLPVGSRAVVVGAEHVSFSAVLTLAHAGARAVALVTEHRADQTFALLRYATAGLRRVPVLTGSRVKTVLGRGRVEAVEVEDLERGTVRRIACDTVVCSGDWIPDHELARLGEIVIDTGTRGPRIDGQARTSRRGVFAVGNLIHAAEAADVASRCGADAASAVCQFLADGRWPEQPVPIAVEDPLEWISPNAVEANGAGVPHGRYLLRVSRVAGPGALEVRQGERRLAAQKVGRLMPNRRVSLAPPWLGDVDPSGPTLRAALV